MASLNKKISSPVTHEGGKASIISKEAELRRSVMACLLWENTFYENGEDIGKRITQLAGQVSPAYLAQTAIEARSQYNLRHVPLLLLAVLCHTGKGSDLVSTTIQKVIQRADELAEFVVIYAKVNGVGTSEVRKKLSAQAKKGLASAFRKFDGYQLAKYNRDSAVKLRDVLFMCHAKPQDSVQEEVWKNLVNGTLLSPDTWEVSLSGGANKKETFERLLREEKLGYMALLKNLRNMESSGVDPQLVFAALSGDKGGFDRVLPFRFISAARAVPQWENEIDAALCRKIADMVTLPGKTAVLVDVSGSMDDRLSGKSDLQRVDAAAALASIVKSEQLRVFTFSNNVVEVPPRRGMAGVDAVIKSQQHGGTYLARAVQEVSSRFTYDRIIVITDEQSADGGGTPLPGSKAYMINVAAYQNGVGYEKWVKINGFSENVLRFIEVYENGK
jgi:60 kDa SS-A/Ro ribonucleoprotein